MAKNKGIHKKICLFFAHLLISNFNTINFMQNDLSYVSISFYKTLALLAFGETDINSKIRPQSNKIDLEYAYKRRKETMKKVYSFVHLFLVAVFASMIAILVFAGVERVFSGSPVFAQDMGSQDLVLYANSRRDTDKDVSFIFYDKKTGDLWVYRNEDFKEQYKVKSMGDNLEKIK